MRMIERRGRAHALEFPGADLDHRNPRIVVKVGDNVFRHWPILCYRTAAGTFRPHHSDTGLQCLAELRNQRASMPPKRLGWQAQVETRSRFMERSLEPSKRSGVRAQGIVMALA